MTLTEQFQQEIIDWINSDEAKMEFHRSQNFSVSSFPDAVRHLYDYFDSGESYENLDEKGSQNVVEIPSGVVQRRDERETNSHLIVILALSQPEQPAHYFKVVSELVDDTAIYWKGASIKEVYPRRVTIYVDEPPNPSR
jgi:hypothetical protein